MYPTITPYRWSSGPKDADIWASRRGIIISIAPDEYIIAGQGFIVTFETDAPEQFVAGIISVQQGSFKDGTWVGGRWLNGDENHQGRHVRLPFGKYDIQQVKLYTYK